MAIGGDGAVYTAFMLVPVLVMVLLSVSAFTPTRQLDASGRAEPLVIGETFTISSSALKEVRRINVYVPPGYAESDQRVPVLYMPDGGIGEDFLHIAGLIQISVTNGTMRPFLLVGIENTERRRDMTPPTDSADDRKIAPRVGGSAAFRTFIRTELMPAVKARYRTAEGTAVIGESLAGLLVVETFLREPDLFDTYIAIDPSLWWNDGKLVAGAGEQLGTRPLARRTLYLSSSGDAGLGEVIGQLTGVLQKGRFPGVSWHYEPLEEERHSTIYHPAALRAFRLLFKRADR